MDWITDPQIWISFLTLTVLEIVLGIDNIVFISIQSARLPEHQQKRARRLGLIIALVSRIALLFSIKWVMGLTSTWINLAQIFDIDNPSIMRYLELSGRDIILFLGGLFLIYKSTTEIHHRVEGHAEVAQTSSKLISFRSVLIQILILDIVFSLDSVITAVGMVDQIGVMVAAVIVAVLIMLISAEAISSFVNNHPSVKMLALAFLLLIGVSLTAEAFDQQIPKGYIYFAMAFSVLVEFLNLRAQKRAKAKLEE